MSESNFESYFPMCIAYLEIGIISSGNANDTGEYQNAVAYQLYHALELFVKYAILKKTGHVNKTHDFTELFKEYDYLYPDEDCRIEHPFEFSKYESCELNLNEKDAYEKHIKQFKPKFMDQHLRYPPDDKTGGFSFKIDADYFVTMKDKLENIYSRINC